MNFFSHTTNFKKFAESRVLFFDGDPQYFEKRLPKNFLFADDPKKSYS